ncbi:MAG: exopolysaccharide biosynthesis protein [Candidatus Koribacter versatilis]|uniref:protein-tyrosine-phosphatase n=1 Tax=Candidatus Korobacter versatilis TaxID=658062 RepID=A0A932A8A5_9BACT|nr:exopolysaccharide biosynthesis protein [Candidatus Koribacter versatilis]
MIDIHCHLLPGVDDGSKSWEMTRAMLRVAAGDGITHIVCTPHANDSYPYDRVEHLGRVAEAQAMAGEWPQLLLGCDFHLSYDNIQDALAHPRRYTVGSTPYLLIEFSDFGVAPGVLESVHRLIGAGMRPIITHPERNATLGKNHEMVLRLVELGCFVQVTASALTGYWGDGVRLSTEQLFKRRLVHVLASDAHDPERRAPRLAAARDAAAKLTDGATAMALVEDNPRAVIEGRPLPYLPDPARAGA